MGEPAAMQKKESSFKNVFFGVPGLNPDAWTQDYTMVTIAAEAKGPHFIHFVPAMFNFACAAAKGYLEPENRDALKQGQGNVSSALRRLDNLVSELKSAGKTEADIQKDPACNALKTQVAYLEMTAFSYEQFRMAQLLRDYAAAKTAQDAAITAVEKAEGNWFGNLKLKRQEKHATKQLKAYQRALEVQVPLYQALLARETNLVNNILDKANGLAREKWIKEGKSEDEFKADTSISVLTEGKEYTLNEANAAKYAIRPGIFVDSRAAEQEVKGMARYLRGENLRYTDLIPLPPNPNHIKSLRLYFKDGSKRKRDPRLPTHKESVSIQIKGMALKLFRTEKVIVPIAFTLGVLYTAACIALVASFLISLATPVGLPLAVVVAAAVGMFGVELLNNHDDWANRAKRIAGAITRFLSGTAFNKNGFSYRSTERFSTARALFTSFLLLFIGIDLTMIGVGAGLSVADFFLEHSLIARAHPVAIIAAAVVFALMAVNSMITPRIIGFLRECGLFFKEPTNRIDLDAEIVPLVKENLAFAEKRQLKKDEQKVEVDEEEARDKELGAVSTAAITTAFNEASANKLPPGVASNDEVNGGYTRRNRRLK